MHAIVVGSINTSADIVVLVETPVDSLTTKVIMVNVMLVVARGAAPQQLMYPERHADSRPRSMPLLTLFHMGVLHHSNQPDLPAGARRKPNVLSDQLPRQASSTKVADPRGQLGRNPSWSPRRPAASGSPPPRLDLAHRHPYSLRPSLRLESRNDWEQSQEDVTAEVGTTVLRRVQRRLLQRMEGNLELLEVEYRLRRLREGRLTGEAIKAPDEQMGPRSPRP